MTVHRMSPRIPALDDRVVPVFPRGRSPRPLAWLVIVFAVVPALLALVGDELGFRVVMGSLAVTVLLVGLSLLSMFGAVSSRAICVDDGAGSLRFVPARAATAPMFVVGFSLLMPAIARIVTDASGSAMRATSVLVSVGPYLLGLLGVGVLVLHLVRLRVPAGLTLTASGLRGIRGHGDLTWRWDELAQVAVIAAPAAKLSLVPVGGGRPVLAPALALGSDPNLVAAIVEFYRRHPVERDVLEIGGTEAVRRVEQSVRR